MGAKPVDPEREQTAALAGAFIDANPDYELREPDGSVTPPEASPTPIGSGGASVVFLALYKHRLRRAVKLLSPKSDLLKNQSAGSFLVSFENEQTMLSELNHENLALLIDFGSIDTGSPGVPFVAMQFVDGASLESFLNREGCTWAVVYRLLAQILTGIAYLHQNRVMHCDIKPENIKIRQADSPGDFNAIVLDLGCARRIPEDLTDEMVGELTYFFSTKKFTLPDLRPYLANKSGNRIPWEVLHAAFPHQDLYGFAKLLENITTAPPSGLPNSVLGGLKEMIERLENKKYGSAGEVLDALGRLRGNSWNGIDSPDLLTGPAARTAIRTPLGLVGIDGRVEALVDHPLFQRLRRVPQLDLLDHFLPGGTHTRFMHSLHVLELARGAISRMASETSITIDLDPQLVDMFLFRALLINIGYYQLLHIFEDFLEDRKRDPAIGRLQLLSDEDMFRQVIRASTGEAELAEHPWTSLTDQYGRTFPALVRELLGDEWIARQQPKTKPYSPIEALLTGLISSPIDLSKMAYIIDHSQMTGLHFGKAIDPDEIFASLVRPQTEDMNGGPVVAVREGAVSYIENSVFARYWLIQKGCWNKKNRSLQVMVKFVIAVLIRAGRFDFHTYLHDTVHTDAFTAMGYLSQQFEAARRDGVIDKDIRNPISDFLLSRRVIYSRVLTLSPRSQTQVRRGDEPIYSELSGKTTLALNDVAEDIRMVLTNYLHINTRPGDVLVDLPRRRREESGGRVVVYSDDRRENLGDLYLFSPILTSIKDSFDLFAKRLRVFIHPECLRSADVEKSVIRERILAHLHEKYGPAR